jgi:hypothetical protein
MLPQVPRNVYWFLMIGAVLWPGATLQFILTEWKSLLLEIAHILQHSRQHSRVHSVNFASHGLCSIHEMLASCLSVKILVYNAELLFPDVVKLYLLINAWE